MKKISIIIPVYNEINTLEKIINLVSNVELNLEKEIIIVDDGSTDGSSDLIRRRRRNNKVVFHDRNLGKGAAIHSGLKVATGDYIIIQDADLEYDPNEYSFLVREMEKGGGAIVYGSRNIENNPRFKRTYYWGGKFITFLTNLLYRSNLTDVNTCYKLFKAEVLKSLPLKEKGFSFCEEVTAKILKNGYSIKEIPIHYFPRRFDEGKKIRAKDAVIAILALIKYRIYD